MKELFLFRHAKTHPAGHAHEDHARSLTYQGQLAATQVGERLAAEGRRPRLVLASDAQRTLQTAGLAMASLGLAEQVMPLAELYQASAEDILGLLAGRPEDSIMIVGHNPSIEELADRLVGNQPHMSPGFCLWIQFDIMAWEELYGRPPILKRLIYQPDELP